MELPTGGKAAAAATQPPLDAQRVDPEAGQKAMLKNCRGVRWVNEAMAKKAPITGRAVLAASG